MAALLFPGGKTAEALGRVTAGTDRLLVSRPTIQEVVGVPSRKKSGPSETGPHNDQEELEESEAAHRTLARSRLHCSG